MSYLIVGNVLAGKITSYNTKTTEASANAICSQMISKGITTAFVYANYDGTPLEYATVTGTTITWDTEEIEADEYESALQVILGKRKTEYPNIAEYLDAKVKQASDDLAIQESGIIQEEEYLQACLFVKENNPKPVEE